MLSPTTVAIVAIGALVIFGPKKLPELARSLGKSLSEFKAGAEEAQDAFKREMNRSPEAPKAQDADASSQKPREDA
ncbi:twin-arginine translocase TatA/TatE family subunit [bacterium]|nr:twin-arginine translocase TatA/TatE family subunit [bacterium]